MPSQTLFDLGLDQVEVSGQKFSNTEATFSMPIDLPNVQTFLTFDTKAVKARIERLPWVDIANVERALPNRLLISVTERQPYAVWRQGSKDVLIDASGRQLATIAAGAAPGLPIVAGVNANEDARRLLDLIAGYPDIARRLTLAERVSDRRWRLVLNGRVTIELPVEADAAALAMLVEDRPSGRLSRHRRRRDRPEGRAPDRCSRPGSARQGLAMGQSRRFMARRSRGRTGEVIGVLDIGTSKICCLIAAAQAPHRLLGVGYQRSRGVRAGLLVDLEAAEKAVLAAVGRAERQAGVTLKDIHVGVSGGQLHSSLFAATAQVASGVVDAADIERLVEGARAYCRRDGRALVHLNRIVYRLDDSAGIRDPKGMAGRVLAGDLHAVTADEGPVSNLNLLIERCFLNPVRFTPTAIASARSVVSREESKSGVTVIDIGAGTTSIAMITDGHDIFSASLPIGGDHLTFDIMSALGTSHSEAERIKILYGTVVEAASDERDVVSYPRLNRGPESESGTELCQTTRAQLRRLIVPRVESLLAQAMERVVASGVQGIRRRYDRADRWRIAACRYFDVGRPVLRPGGTGRNPGAVAGNGWRLVYAGFVCVGGPGDCGFQSGDAGCGRNGDDDGHAGQLPRPSRTLVA